MEISEIEDKIARQEINAAQVFTQMMQHVSIPVNAPSKLTTLLCAKDDCMVGTYSSGLGSETVLVYKHDELANSTDFYAFKYCPICGNKLGT